MTKTNDTKACFMATFDLHHYRRRQSSPSIVVNIIILIIVVIIRRQNLQYLHPQQ